MSYSAPAVLLTSSAKNRQALRWAERAHRGVTRKAAPDTPYILHPVAVATAVAAVGGDRNMVCAACLHDVVEDSDVTTQDIFVEFGAEVAALVDAMTKPKDMKRMPLEEQARVVVARLKACEARGVNLGLKACVLKGADVLINVTDLIFDIEEQGVQVLVLTLGKGDDAVRAGAKVNHYLDLMDLLSAELDGTVYAELVVALRARGAELLELAAQMPQLGVR
jgi:(p)ppGpp synthase/HD superfamily hydrolase